MDDIVWKMTGDMLKRPRIGETKRSYRDVAKEHVEATTIRKNWKQSEENSMARVSHMENDIKNTVDKYEKQMEKNTKTMEECFKLIQESNETNKTTHEEIKRTMPDIAAVAAAAAVKLVQERLESRIDTVVERMENTNMEIIDTINTQVIKNRQEYVESWISNLIANNGTLPPFNKPNTQLTNKEVGANKMPIFMLNVISGQKNT